MSAVGVLLLLVIACALVASVAAVLVTAWLDRRGLKTPFALMRLYFFRNLARYREITYHENGQVGALFYWTVVPFAAALLLALGALVVYLLP